MEYKICFVSVKNADKLYGVFGFKLGKTTEKDIMGEVEKNVFNCRRRYEKLSIGDGRVYNYVSYDSYNYDLNGMIYLYFIDGILVAIDLSRPSMDYFDAFINKYSVGFGGIRRYRCDSKLWKEERERKREGEKRCWENATVKVEFFADRPDTATIRDISKHRSFYFSFYLKDKEDLYKQISRRTLQILDDECKRDREREEKKREEERKERLSKFDSII